MMSSRLGLVADVIATESPSQLSPVVIQSTCAVIASVFLWSATAAVAIPLPLLLTLPATPRYRVSDELIHDPLAAKARLDQHHPGGLRPHLADLGRLLAPGYAPQRLQRPLP